MIKISDITLAYDEKTVPIKHFSYEFTEGVYAVCGASGSGKSTLLKGMCGILKPVSGSIERTGKLSAVFQESRLIMTLSAEKNLLFVCDDADKVHEILSSLGLGEFMKKTVSGLSGGQQRRVAIGRALAFGGDAVILDEPFEGLDADLRKKTAELIRNSFPLIIVSTHDIRDAEYLAGNSSPELIRL